MVSTPTPSEPIEAPTPVPSPSPTPTREAAWSKPVDYADGTFWDGIREVLGREENEKDVIRTCRGKVIAMSDMSDVVGEELQSLFPIAVNIQAPWSKPIEYANATFWERIREVLGREENEKDLITTCKGQEITMNDMANFVDDDLQNLFPISVKIQAPGQCGEPNESPGTKPLGIEWPALLETLAAPNPKMTEEEKAQKKQLKDAAKRRKDDAKAMELLEEWRDWRETVLSGESAPVPSLMPRSNLRRLLAEYRKVQVCMVADAAFVKQCQPEGDNLLVWHVDMSFPEDTPMQKSLLKLSEQVCDATLRVLTLQVRFPPEYPLSPPHIYVEKPRLKQDGTHGRSSVSFSGKICSPLLTSRGWNKSATMPAVLEQVQHELLDVGAEVDVAIATVKSKYAPPAPQLDRTLSDRYPTLYDFCKEGIKLGSVETLLPENSTGWMDIGDSIGLPQEFADEIYGELQYQSLSGPMVFEVTSAGGKKVHCGRPQFLDLPANYTILPPWMISELLVEHDDVVRIRCVHLEPITYVKIQPHNSDFYAAVKNMANAEFILTQAFQHHFGALTEDISVTLEIDGNSHKVHIVDLQPASAVRLLEDQGRIVEFEVELATAPDYETDAENKERIAELLKRRQVKKALEIQESRESRIARAKKDHFEQLKESVKSKVNAACDNGKEGEVLIQLKLGNGKVLTAALHEGALAAALVPFVLDSDWAESCHPWGVKFISPCDGVLDEGEIITKRKHHRSRFNVVEVKPEDPLLPPDSQPNPDPPKLLKNVQIPKYVERRMINATLEAFSAQCETIANNPLPKARCGTNCCPRFPYDGRRGETCCRTCTETSGLEHGPVCSQNWEAWRLANPEAAVARDALVRVPAPAIATESAQEAMIANFCEVAGVDPDVARQVLEVAGWNEAEAFNFLFDQ